MEKCKVFKKTFHLENTSYETWDLYKIYAKK